MARKPVIGSYKRTDKPAADANIQDKRAKEPDTPAKVMRDGIQGDIKDSVESSAPLEEKVKSYQEILKENDIEEYKAQALVDSMLEKGFHEETLSVTKRASVTFRTRSHKDYIRYLRALELFSPKYVEEQQELQIRYFLAASLVTFKGRKFANPEPGTANEEETETAFKERISWLEQQPEGVISLLANKLNVFDKQVRIIMSEGVVENF